MRSVLVFSSCHEAVVQASPLQGSAGAAVVPAAGEKEGGGAEKTTVRTVASIMNCGEAYSFMRTDFQGTVAAMAELASSPDVPMLDVTPDLFNTHLLKCLCNEVQTYVWNKEFGYVEKDDYGETAKLDMIGVQVDVATGKVFHNFHDGKQFREFKGANGKEHRLYFAGRASTI